MVLRLINDATWRARTLYLAMLPLVLFVWAFNAVGVAPASMGLMVSMMLAYMMGPVISVMSVGMREIRVLPVTNRELWLATCLLSIVVGPLFLLAAQLVAATGVKAFTGSTAVSGELLILSTVYSVAYAGILLPIAPLLGYASGNLESRKPRWLWIALTAVCVVIFIGGFGFPWLFADSLPLAFDQLTPLGIAALSLCLVVTLAATAWTPTRGGIARAFQPGPHHASTSHSKHPRHLADRFTGLARIAWTHAVITVALTATLMAGFVAYWAVADPGEALRPFMERHALFPFAGSAGSDLYELTVLFGFIVIAGNGVWNPLAKQLKVLPLTVREINGLFVVTPLMTWALVWLVMIVTYRVVTGTLPETPRLEALTFVWGTSALGHMLALRFKRLGGFPWFFMPLGVAASALISTIDSTPSTNQSVALAAAGLACLGVAALVNHRTLTRSTSSANAYQRQYHPIGVIGPGAPR